MKEKEVKICLEEIQSEFENSLYMMDIFGEFITNKLSVSQDSENFIAFMILAYKQLPKYSSVFFTSLNEFRHIKQRLDILTGQFNETL